MHETKVGEGMTGWMDGWGVPANGAAMEEWQGGEWLEKSIRVGQGTEITPVKKTGRLEHFSLCYGFYSLS